jgi:hypothetical protein
MIKSRKMQWKGHVAGSGEKMNPHGVLVIKPQGKIPLGRQRYSCEDNIKNGS